MTIGGIRLEIRTCVGDPAVAIASVVHPAAVRAEGVVEATGGDLNVLSGACSYAGHTWECSDGGCYSDDRNILFDVFHICNLLAADIFIEIGYESLQQ